MAIMMYASPLPAGCHDDIADSPTGQFRVVVFPGGEVRDAAIAGYWRYDPDLLSRDGNG